MLKYHYEFTHFLTLTVAAVRPITDFCCRGWIDGICAAYLSDDVGTRVHDSLNFI